MEAVDAALSIAPSRSERPVVASESISKMGCAATISIKDIIMGDRSALLTALSALFDRYPSIEYPTQEKLEKLEVVVRDLRVKVKDMEETFTVNASATTSGKQFLDELDQLAEQAAKLKEEKNKLIAELEAEKKDNASLREKLTNANEMIRNEREQAKAEREKMRESQLSSSRSTVDERFKSIQDSFQVMIDSREKLIDEQKGKMKTLNETIAQLQAELVEERKKQGSSQDSATKDLNDRIAKLQTDLETKESNRTPNRSPEPADDDKKKKKKKDEKEKKSYPGDEDVESMKKSLANAELRIRQYEDLVKNLEGELEEEKKAFDELVDLQGKQNSENKAATSSSLANRKNELDADLSKKESKILEEALKKEKSNAAAQVKYLATVLVDLKQDLQKRLEQCETKLQKNNEINEIMKQKISAYVLEQMKSKGKSPSFF